MHRRLLVWFDRHRRDLPWRLTKDPYRVWISEMMLQQTQVATALPYYEKFLAAFPTVRRLAAAKLDDVLRHWAGLGYYARARNMHRTAKMIVEELGGKFPSNREGLLKLPGIGPYSAAAIASIVYDEPAAVVDGNVIRVISRLFGVRKDVTSIDGKRAITGWADALIPTKRCGDFNQAMMELGATVCLPGNAARCDDCPLNGNCRALAAGAVARLPLKRKRIKVTNEVHVVAAVRRGRRWLAVQRPQNGLWGGLWELPTAVAGETAPRSLAADIAMRWTNRRSAPHAIRFCRLDRLLSHRRIRFVGYRFEANANHSPGNGKTAQKVTEQQKAQWLTLGQLRTLPMSTAMQAVVRELEQATALQKA